MGGSVKAIEDGYMQDEIAGSAYRYQRDIQTGEKPIIGVNKFTIEEKPIDAIFKVDDSIRQVQIEKINKVKASRNNEEVSKLLSELKVAAEGTENLMPYILRCAEAYATLGEIADVLRDVFGEYKA
jgi:methylmalonyl-CoA mutase N-terminal domain/subunit